MKRVLAALIAVVALLGSVVVAQAATLTLDAGTLQVLRVTKSPEIPEGVSITLRAIRYNQNTHGQIEADVTQTRNVPAGDAYRLAWDGVFSHQTQTGPVACKPEHAGGYEDVMVDPENDGWSPPAWDLVIEEDRSFILCVQANHGSTDFSKFRLLGSDGDVLLRAVDP
jgi:hypothetical protein